MDERESMEGVGDEEMEYVEDDSSGSESGEEENQEGKVESRVYLPGEPIAEDEEMVCDESAYHMYHQMQTGAPCLSFDILRDGLGDQREHYPLTCYIVAGTQAERSHTNSVIVMKMSNLKRTSKADKDKSEEESESDSDSEDEDDKPELETAMIKHNGAVNRIRATQVNNKSLAASWSERGKVHVWDLTRPLHAVNDSQVMATYTRNQESPAAMFTFTGHQAEGYALDWSTVTPGHLLSGDCTKNIHLWSPQEGGSWHIDQRPFIGHTASVEDIQWSPTEENVFASCSVDKSLRIWDARAAPSKACMLTTSEAHTRDINVINWNKNEPFIVSGGDDGMIKIWDLRQFHQGKAVAVFKHHTAPITSVDWHPTDGSVLAASGSDDQITFWDLALERDTEVEGQSSQDPQVPPQLLFIHQGQTDIKEIHWHPQLPGVMLSTAHSGFNIFRTISV